MPKVETTISDQIHSTAGAVWSVHDSDARQTGMFLQRIASRCGAPDVPFLTCTITSPPYANLVDYGTANQIGFGQTYEEYLDECEQIFRDTYKWTREDGSLWIVADTMMGESKRGQPSALVPLPFALADRASRAGWVLREVIIWHKDRTRPWAAAGKLRNAFEYILYFVKSGEFQYHVERLRDVRGLRSWWIKYPERHNPWGMTPDNVWEIPIPVQGSWTSSTLRHACPFPEDLVRRIVELSSDPGDVVFDPFAGSGMVPAVAESLGRKPLGTEISADFRTVYIENVRPTVLSTPSRELDVDSTDITATLLALRILKFPKALANQVMRAGVHREDLLALIAVPEAFDLTPHPSPYAALDCLIVVRDDADQSTVDHIRATANKAVAQPPLSKWAVSSRIRVMRIAEADAALAEVPKLSLYEAGRTWNSSQRLSRDEIWAWIETAKRSGVPPVFSSLQVQVELEN